jgi:type I restriction enzyme M protein
MSTDSSATIVSKVWNYAHVLKNAGVGYGDYVEQITYLLFLKLAEEMSDLGYDNPIPPKFGWSVLSSMSGDELEVHYRHTLENLGTEPGLVGIIFRKAQNKISNPSDLQRVIKMIAPPSPRLRRAGDDDGSGMVKPPTTFLSSGQRTHHERLDGVQAAAGQPESDRRGRGQRLQGRP